MDKLRVIVADDHEDMLHELVRMLQKDFEIIGTASNGRELVDAAIAVRPDVIVTDISMPRLSGPQALQELKTQGYKFPFVFVSATQGYKFPFVFVNSLDDMYSQFAWSFVDKMDVCVELVPAVQAVASGKTYVSSRHRAQIGIEP